jgi:hypothetical protein
MIIDDLAATLKARGLRPFHRLPRQESDADTEAFWTKANKHKHDLPLDKELLRCYIAFSLLAGVPIAARGIPVPGKGFVHLDRARMNGVLSQKLARFENGTFKLTEKGLRCLGLA